MSKTGEVSAPSDVGAGNHVSKRDVAGLRQLVDDLREQNAQLARQVDQLQASLTAARARSARQTGERRVVTVLFADLRDSTPLAEDLPAETMVELLNAYLGALARCVLAEGGMVDKFLGDGLMAVFGVLDDSGDGAGGAARAVVQMRRAVQALNDARALDGEESVSFGVGIHTGEVVFGPVGLPGRSDYTAIGDTVNTAARLSGLCREFGVDAILSSETAVRLETDDLILRELGAATIRGKARAMTVSTLV